MEWISLVVAAVLGTSISGFVAHRWLSRRRDDLRAAARAQATTIKRVAELDAQTIVHSAEAEAREKTIELLDQEETKMSQRFEELARLEERVAKREAGLDAQHKTLRVALEQLSEREQAAQVADDSVRAMREQAHECRTGYRHALEELAAVTGAQLRDHVVDTMVLEAKAQAAQRIRTIEQSSADPEYSRQAKRIMGISVARYYGHYLTERLLPTVMLPEGFADTLRQNDGKLLKVIEEVSGATLELAQTGEKLRIESGGDGVAREIARRALSKVLKGNRPDDYDRQPTAWVVRIKENLLREIVGLGRKAFAELKIPKAHLEIVQLVGRLNYRTSYTQNQWKHALEAAFLAGMMAAELGLDVKLARRATLMHDIGKSLTHEIEGSHAVIGAEYARRLGEAEIVANAIGAHHAEEPANSVYAHLVAAADAMSGGRPGARREQTENYANRLVDLERIGREFAGVDQVFAVSGGREVRVYVKDDVDDTRTVALSSEISQKISDELTFPGQIKVTVIRQFEAVSTAS